MTEQSVSLHGLIRLAAPMFLVWQEPQTGALETVMEDWLADPMALHILTPPGRNRPARVQALIEHLAQAFASEPWAGVAELVGPL